MMLIADQRRVTETVEVVTVEFMDSHGNTWRQHETRCTVCPVVAVWEHFHHAVNDARRHVCETPS